MRELGLRDVPSVHAVAETIDATAPAQKQSAASATTRAVARSTLNSQVQRPEFTSRRTAEPRSVEQADGECS